MPTRRKGEYASATPVPISRSREEIERTLANYDAASHVLWGSSPQSIVLGFLYRGWQVRITVPVPPRETYRENPNDWRPRSDRQVELFYQAEVKRLYRVLLLLLKGKLEAIKSRGASAEAEFLPYFVLPSGATVAEQLGPELEEMLLSGHVPPLLPGPPVAGARQQPPELPQAPTSRQVLIREERSG